MKTPHDRSRDVPTQIKNKELVDQRRRQIVEAVIPLFTANGFHKTTTRQIARAVGFSIGSLYEYVASKEDVLYLVCVYIHDEVEHGIAEALSRSASGRDALIGVIREFIMVCHRLSDLILLMYQVTQSLPPQWQQKVLENEIRITNLIGDAVARMAAAGELPHLKTHSIDLIANNISVLGHAWAFRRWHLSKSCSIEEYIAFQTDFILGTAAGSNAG